MEAGQTLEKYRFGLEEKDWKQPFNGAEDETGEPEQFALDQVLIVAEASSSSWQIKRGAEWEDGGKWLVDSNSIYLQSDQN